ncbi:MAG: bifunctional UDP-N-acetylglucosamine diphosphorylase/glucosamine-1-phosphate N-acetyltransferase GlmU [Desulfovibrionaceae bacterium]|nr:bifunctional UDP-N-acetylglucosamine diphosphorylase/glucosamine-1-phosphate N-acetyltransferase GlmU [Desulfovibrionaceae bacterium]
MNNINMGALVLAAGKGTRMNSANPKVLQEVLGEPILSYVYAALNPIFNDKIWTIVGHQAELVTRAFPDRSDRFVLQEQQLGTGHALQTAWPALLEAGLSHVLVVSGDIPLITTAHLETFIEAMGRTDAPLGFISMTLPRSGAYGMVLREKNKVVDIIEAKDYSPAIHGEDTGEINTGIYLINVAKIGDLLPQLSNRNKSGEFYITELISLAARAGMEVVGARTGDLNLLGVNTPGELVRTEEMLRRATVEKWLERGAALHYPDMLVIGPRAEINLSAHIYGPCHLLGDTRVEAGAIIESNCVLKDSVVGEGARVRSFSHLEQAVLGAGTIAGPYARLRPGAVLDEGAKIGNFVEMKKAVLRKGAKVNHLSYIGDAEVGAGANIGAGTITCNYDGVNKHRTEIGAGAFIGSNSALVAPVKIGSNALVAAGSVITKDVPPDTLAFGRAQQKNREKNNPLNSDLI